jgi:predicted AAA+ superfamily ATPase
MLYLNFEDDRLQPIREGDLDLVLRSFRELYPDSVGDKVYLFLDEVQSAPGWELWARRLHDTENIEIFVTGSSSQLLARDLSTALRGRSITLEVFPLSFKEFLTFRSIPVIAASADNESLLRSAVVEYLEWGGFPEIVLADEAMRPLILEEYTSLMLYRDILERYGVRNEKLMRELLRHAFRNTASLLNVSKLHRDLASQGYQVSKNTLFEYLGYLEDAFLVFLLPIQEASIRTTPKNSMSLIRVWCRRSKPTQAGIWGTAWKQRFSCTGGGATNLFFTLRTMRKSIFAMPMAGSLSILAGMWVLLKH